MPKAAAIINPTAANGKASKVWQQYNASLKTQGILCSEFITEAPGHGISFSKQALMQGCELILAVGGDGTLNEVANGFFDNGKLINPDATLGIVPKGTGTDFVRTLNVPKTSDALAKCILKNQTRKIDVGRLACHSFDGQPITRYFINVADVGYGGAL
ncbi:MAG: diacylglycerol/lipid kinase family protein, partial [bacterium]